MAPQKAANYTKCIAARYLFLRPHMSWLASRRYND